MRATTRGENLGPRPANLEQLRKQVHTLAAVAWHQLDQPCRAVLRGLVDPVCADDMHLPPSAVDETERRLHALGLIETRYWIEDRGQHPSFSGRFVASAWGLLVAEAGRAASRSRGGR